MPDPLHPTQHVLYRHFGAGGELLYVGITVNPGSRLSNHANGSEWWCDVVGVTLERFESRAELREAEKAAIWNERPLYNKTHNAEYRRISRPRGPRRELVKVGAEPLPAELDRAVINGTRYVLPPGLAWDETRGGYTRR